MEPEGYIELPTGDGFITAPIYSQPSCPWLVPDMTDGIPDAVPCEAPVSGRECAAGHIQLGTVAAFNEPGS
jgi:hypothetical protein